MSGMAPEIKKKVGRFFSNYRLQNLDKNQILIYGGHEPAGVFFLVRGQVRQYDISPGGKEVVVNIFKTPAFFPMSWAINRTPNRYFFETATKVSLRQAPAEVVVEFVKANPDVMLDLLGRVYLGTDGLLRRLAHQLGGNARSRVLFELINVSRRFGRTNKDGSCLVLISEKELAKRSGLSRETVSRQLSLLKKQGQLQTRYNKLLIKDLTSLEDSLGDSL